MNSRVENIIQPIFANSFINSDTPIARLLDKEIPAVQTAKKDLEQVVKRHQSAQVQFQA